MLLKKNNKTYLIINDFENVKEIREINFSNLTPLFNQIERFLKIVLKQNT